MYTVSRQVFAEFIKKITSFWILKYNTLKVLAALAFAIFNSHCSEFETAELKNPLVFANGLRFH